MSEEIRIDESSGESRVVNGVEEQAFWLPLTAAEKRELFKAAKEKGIDIPQLLAGFFRDFLAHKR